MQGNYKALGQYPTAPLAPLPWWLPGQETDADWFYSGVKNSPDRLVQVNLSCSSFPLSLPLFYLLSSSHLWSIIHQLYKTEAGFICKLVHLLQVKASNNSWNNGSIVLWVLISSDNLLWLVGAHQAQCQNFVTTAGGAKKPSVRRKMLTCSRALSKEALHSAPHPDGRNMPNIVRMP